MGLIKDRIIILHGWSYSIDKWQRFKIKLDDAGYFVDLVKIPGLTLKSDDVWDLSKYTRWLNEYLKKYKEKIILVGHSNGGRMAISYSVKYPDKIKKLILIDSAGIYHNDFPIRVKRMFFKFLSSVGKKISKSNSLRKVLYKFAGERDYEQANSNMKKTMKNLISIDLKPVLNKIKTSTLIIWGGKDKITPLKDGILMKSLIKDSKIRVVDTAKHSPFYTHTSEVVNLLIKELNK